MLEDLAKVTLLSTPKNRLPDELEILVNNIAQPPTHLMAVYGSKKTLAKPTAVKLYPVHAIVFAANCARLPTLKRPAPHRSQTVQARVQRLCLPAPRLFPHVSTFLYTKQASILFSEPFLPRVFNPSRYTPAEFAAELGLKCSSQALIKHIATVHGFWQNVCALGIFDQDLWIAMDLVWHILLAALAFSTQS
jgi:hypothetical protein